VFARAHNCSLLAPVIIVGGVDARRQSLLAVVVALTVCTVCATGRPDERTGGRTVAAPPFCDDDTA
jgi:hypothetical protein